MDEKLYDNKKSRIRRKRKGACTFVSGRLQSKGYVNLRRINDKPACLYHKIKPMAINHRLYCYKISTYFRFLEMITPAAAATKGAITRITPVA